VQDNLARIAVQSARERQDSLSSIGMGTQDSQDQQALTALNRQYDDLIAQAGRSLRHGDITQPEYDKEVSAYKEQLAQELDAERGFFAERNAMQADWVNGAQQALANYVTSAANVASQTNQLFSDAFSGLEDAIVTFVQTGKLSFTSLANSIIADIARMEAKAAVSGLMQYAASAIGSYFGGSGTSFQSLGGDTSYLGNSYSTGSYTGGFQLAGGRASGGNTAGGSLYEVVEHGPELYQSGGRTYLLSGKDGYVTPASSGGRMTASGGSGGLAAVNIYNTQGDKVSATASQSKGPNGMQQLDIVIDSIEKKIAGNVAKGQGPLSSALTSRYNLNKGQNL
jgi:lambda family phage tail tape measure protein